MFERLFGKLVHVNVTVAASPRHEPDEGDTISSVGVYFESARHFLDVQMATMDVLDTKTWQSFSVGSTVLTVTFALLNLSSRDVPPAAFWALGTALFGYIVLLVCSFRASSIRGLEYRPNIERVKAYSEEISGTFLQQWVSNEYLASIVQNKPLLERKARWVGATQLALHGEALSLVAAAMLTLIAN